MAPPLFFMLLVAAVIIVGAAIAVWGVRAGLWLSETSTSHADPEADDEGRPDDRPEHARVEEPGHQTFTPHR